MSQRFEDFFKWLLEIARLRPGSLQLLHILRQTVLIEILQSGIWDNLLIDGRLGLETRIAVNFVIGHLPIGVSNADVSTFLQAGDFIVTRFPIGGYLGNLDGDDGFPFKILDRETGSKRRLHLRGRHMADFLLKTLGVSDSDDFKPFTFIQSQKKDPATGAVTKCGQSLKQPLRRAVQRCLHFHIVQFALELLNSSDNFCKVVEGHF